MLVTVGRCCWICWVTQSDHNVTLSLLKNIKRQVSGTLDLMASYDKGKLALDNCLVKTFKVIIFS